MFTINVLTTVLTVWFCLNEVGFSSPKNGKVNVLDDASDHAIGDQDYFLKTRNPSERRKERIGTRRRVKFTQRITQRLGIFDQLLASYKRREGLVYFPQEM